MLLPSLTSCPHCPHAPIAHMPPLLSLPSCPHCPHALIALTALMPPLLSCPYCPHCSRALVPPLSSCHWARHARTNALCEQPRFTGALNPCVQGSASTECALYPRVPSNNASTMCAIKYCLHHVRHQMVPPPCAPPNGASPERGLHPSC
eukprot:132644-Pelagomonas_calceolata.AAC.5